GGLCFPADGGPPNACGPTESGCLPYGGVLTFNAIPPLTPVYWSLRARRGRTPGRLAGSLSAFTDRAPTLPDVPGVPWRCVRDVCFARRGRFVGAVTGDRFSGIARYARGGRCEFSATVGFGLGGTLEPNTFVCRDASGAVTSREPLQVQ